MFDDAIRLFSAIAATLNLIYGELKTSKERKRATLERVSRELKEFGENVLGWYNEVVGLVASLAVDLKSDELGREVRQKYRQDLARIRAKDEFHTKCRDFVGRKTKRYQAMKTLSADLKEALSQIGWLYSRFESIALSMKNRVWKSLWIDMNKAKRLALSSRLEKDIRSFKRYKNAIMKTLAAA